MELAAGNEPFKSSRILYTGKVFQHGPGRVAAAPGHVKALVGGQAYSAVPCENTMHQPRYAGQVHEGNAGQALNRNILLHRIVFSVTVRGTSRIILCTALLAFNQNASDSKQKMSPFCRSMVKIREQGAGSREQGAGSKEQGARSKEQKLPASLFTLFSLPSS
jgi:hypothetical protein